MTNTGRPKKDPAEQLRGSIHVMVRADVKAALEDITADTWRELFGLIAEMRQSGRPAIIFSTKMNDDNTLSLDTISTINPRGASQVLTIVGKNRGAHEPTK